MPSNTTIHQGSITLKYQEQQLVRTVTFKITVDVDKQVVETITIPISDGTLASH